METIIGLLFILLPVIFKLIGKKLEQSGRQGQAGKVRELAEVFGADEDDAFENWLKGTEPEPEPKPVYVAPAVSRKPEVDAAKPSVSVRRPMLQEETAGKKEKIDPRKLVIYSEIMKPKYTE